MTSLYIHLPFCHKKCFYCSFVVAIAQEHRIDQYVTCLDKEAGAYAGASIDSIYLGGGTPSFLSKEQITNVFMMINKRFKVMPDAEITVECNPESVSDDKLDVFKQQGVNRISLGIQSLNNDDLKYLGRNHDAAEAVLTYERIRRHGFNNVSVDVMFSFPNQEDRKLINDVKSILDLDSEHVSLYGLDIEERSRFHATKVKLDDNHKRAEQYELVRSILEDSGVPQYEVSNFSKPGFESKHNINYWRGGNYIGLGVGAHSHQDGRRFWNVDRLNDYLNRVDLKQTPMAGEEHLSTADRLKERLLFGLRMNEGVNLEAIERVLGKTFDQPTLDKINEFIAQGFIEKKNHQLQATDKGRLVLEEISVALI